MNRKFTRIKALIICVSMFTALLPVTALPVTISASVPVTIRIASVEVINGGAIQAQYRDAVYPGRAAYGEDPAKYYTTMRDASLTDSRRFNLEIVIPAGSLPDLTNPSQAAVFLAGLSWTFGEIPLTQWLSGSGFSSSTPFIQLGNQSISRITSGANAGDYLLETAILFQTPYATSSVNAANNIPYNNYSAINQSGFNRSVMLNGRSGAFPNAGKGIGTYTLRAASSTYGELGSCQLKLNLYDSFNRWEEIDQYAKDLRSLAGTGKTINGRHVEVLSLGKSLEGREIWNVVVAKNVATVNDYLNRIKPWMNTDPDLLMAEAYAGSLTQVIYLNSIHPDETPGSDAIIKTINELIWQDKLPYNTYQQLDRRFTNFTGVTNSRNYHLPLGSAVLQPLSVEEVLENFIIVATITANPDGRYNMIRGNRYGIDLDRDAAFQTQPESMALSRDIAKWDPLVMLDFHGYVTNMLIEPGTLPHNPNYEYDLLQSNMLQLSYQMGKAITGDTAYGVFHVPWDHQTSGWDDNSTGFATGFAMLFGTMAYHIEIPYATEDSVVACQTSVKALLYNLLHGTTAVYNDHPAYANTTLDAPSHANMRQSTLLNKLEWKTRSVKNTDAKSKVDKYLMQYSNNTFITMGRSRKADAANHQLSFFPDYLIIPIDSASQWNPAEAYRSLAIAQEHGVKLLRSTTEITDNAGKKYPAGSYVIPLAQGARNYINELFGKGYDASDFAAMYAETVINYPDTRGFDAIEVWGKDYTASTTAVNGEVSKPAPQIRGNSAAYIAFKSNSVDAVRFVNKLLSGSSSGKYNAPSAVANVWMLRKNTVINEGTTNQVNLPMGTYIIAATDLSKLETLKDDPELGLKGCYIEGWYLGNLPEEAVKLVNPIIHLTTTRTETSANPVYWALDDYLGFSSLRGYDGSGTADLRPGANVLFLNNSAGSAALADRVKADKIGVIGTGSSNVVSFLGSHFTVNGQFGSATGGTTSNSDGIFSGKYNPASLFSAGYAGTATLHLTSNTTYFTALPSNAKPLFTTDTNDPFIGGFYHNWTTQMRNRVVAFSLFTKESNGQNIPVVALPNIFTRPHYQKLYSLLATAIFASAAGILDDQIDPTLNATVDIGTNQATINASASDNESGLREIKAEVFNYNTNQYVQIAATTTGLLPTTTYSVNTSQPYKFRVTATDYAGNVTVYEKGSTTPSPVTHTVKFVNWDGSTITTQSVAKGSKATAPANPTRTGYTFSGWYSNKLCTNLYNFDTVVTGNLTLYTGWTINVKPPSGSVSGVSNARFISIVETTKNSRVWQLTFEVTITYPNGTSTVKKFTIDLKGNNANLDGTYTFPADHELAGYTLTYDIKGNGSNIKAFSIK